MINLSNSRKSKLHWEIKTIEQKIWISEKESIQRITFCSQAQCMYDHDGDMVACHEFAETATLLLPLIQTKIVREDQ